MAVSRTNVVDQNFRQTVAAIPAQARRTDLNNPVLPGANLSAREAIQIFESMVASRTIDFEARVLKGRGEGFYTIGSSGHEGNAVVAAASRHTDTAMLHYRSGAFFIERARQVPGTTPLFDILLGMVGSADEPIAGGRHKVFGSVPLHIPPQTSTIASHLPKAVGAAFAIARAKRNHRPIDLEVADQRFESNVLKWSSDKPKSVLVFWSTPECERVDEIQFENIVKRR